MRPEDLALPVGLLYLLAPLILCLAFVAPLYVVLLLDLGLAIFPLQWRVSDVHVDLTDMTLLAVTLALLLRPRARPGWPGLRHRWLWLAYGALLSVAYVNAPINQEHLTDPIRVAYQLFHWAWRPVLHYPLYVAFFNDRKKFGAALIAVLLAADVCAAQATIQGYASMEATGPFFSKNELGGMLVIPMLVAIGGFFFAPSRRRKTFYALSTLAILRGLTISGSRGAVVAAVLGIMFFAAGLAMTGYGRARLVRFGVAAAALGIVALMTQPDLLERPTVQHMLTASHPEEVDNYQWRKQERWPVFWAKIMAHPWLGMGTDVDLSLGEDANTPHNGYLSIAVTSGIPVLAVFVTFALLAVRGGLRVFRRARDRSQALLGLTLAAALAGFLVHNMVDSTLQMPFATKLFWLLIAGGMLVPRLQPAAQQSPARARVRRLRVARAGTLAAAR